MSAERSNRSSSGRPSGGGRPGGSRGGRPDSRSGSQHQGDKRTGGTRSGSGRPTDKRGGSARTGDSRSSGGNSSSGRSGSGRPGGGRPGDRRQSKGDKFTPKWREELDRPPTAAQQRAAEVDKRRGGPRPPRDPDADRRWAEERVTEQWIDEGSVRDVAAAAAQRAGSVERPRREPHPLDPDIGAELVDALGNQRGTRLSERLAQASEALDRERFDEARRIAASIAKEAPTVSAVQEVLGLASYRLGRYKPAVAALQQAQELHENPALLPVIADAYRGLRRWSAVERVWGQIKAASPSQEVMSEGRIVMASALADQGDLAGAIAVMQDGRKPPKRVRDHHLREWYVLGDLYDRLGETITARRWFGAVAEQAPDFVDVQDRLRGLGR
jgi:tetratricopeptide (TPR) repeat protein